MHGITGRHSTCQPIVVCVRKLDDNVSCHTYCIDRWGAGQQSHVSVSPVRVYL